VLVQLFQGLLIPRIQHDTFLSPCELLGYPSGPRSLRPSLSAQTVGPQPLVLGAALRCETSDYAAPQVLDHRP